MFGSEVYVLFFPEDMGVSDYKIVYIPTGIRNIIRNPSGTVGDVPCLFEDSDV